MIDQPDLNTILVAVATTSLALNGFFLRQAFNKMEKMDDRQEKDGNRITTLEARMNFPHYDRRISPFHGIPPQEG